MTFARGSGSCQVVLVHRGSLGDGAADLRRRGKKSVRIDVLDGRIRLDRVDVGEATFQPESPGELSRGSYQLRAERSGSELEVGRKTRNWCAGLKTIGQKSAKNRQKPPPPARISVHRRRQACVAADG